MFYNYAYEYCTYGARSRKEWRQKLKFSWKAQKCIKMSPSQWLVRGGGCWVLNNMKWKNMIHPRTNFVSISRMTAMKSTRFGGSRWRQRKWRHFLMAPYNCIKSWWFIQGCQALLLPPFESKWTQRWRQNLKKTPSRQYHVTHTLDTEVQSWIN